MTIAPVTSDLAQAAARLRGALRISLPDAVVLATALSAGALLTTNDRGLCEAAGADAPGFPVSYEGCQTSGPGEGTRGGTELLHMAEDHGSASTEPLLHAVRVGSGGQDGEPPWRTTGKSVASSSLRTGTT